MQDLEKLFKETFSNYEEPVRPELWDKISSQIAPTPQPSSGNGSSIASKGAQIAGKLFHGAGIWITGTALVITSVASYYIYQKTTSDKQEVTTTAPETTTETNQKPAQEITVPENKPESSNTNNNGVAITPSNNSTHQNTGHITATEVSANKTGDSKSTVSQEPAHTDNSESTNKPATVASESQNHIANTSDPVQNQVPATINPASLDTETPVISASPSSGYAPLVVSLSYQGTAIDNSWNIGDGSDDISKKSFQHTFNSPGTYTITLKSHDKDGKQHVARQTIEVLEGSSMEKLPNVFTPNGDGLNDIFTIKSGKLSSLDAAIFDKSGRQIYHWTDINGGWDGKLGSGQPAEEGTYFYVIFATGIDQKKYQFKGTLSLIK